MYFIMNELLAVGCDMRHYVMVKFSSDFPLLSTES